MAEGRDRRAWRHTAAVLATLGNVNRARRTDRLWQPEDFDPYAAADGRLPARGMPLTDATLPALGAALGARARRQKGPVPRPKSEIRNPKSKITDHD
jgi:hypothetical protein